MATSYDINYEDQRFKDVEADKQAALDENDKLYNDMIEDSDSYYQAQIDASKEWADKQTQLQQEQTDFEINRIEQEKDQANKDYTKEQSGAYVDWQKQSNDYGVNAEKAAAQGMQNSGWSESSQVSMYNTYQNRVATARESYNKIVMNFDNSITEARLKNNSLLAEIAFEAQQKQLELTLQGFQYKNQLLLEQANKKLEIESEYYQRYQDVLAQINHENALAEQIRQFNLSYGGGGGGYSSAGGSDYYLEPDEPESTGTVLASSSPSYAEATKPKVLQNTSRYLVSAPSVISNMSYTPPAKKELTPQQQKAYDLYKSRH